MDINKSSGCMDPQVKWADYAELPNRDVSKVRHQSLPDVPHRSQLPSGFNTSSYQPILSQPDTSSCCSTKDFGNKVSQASTTLEVDVFSIMALIHEMAQTQKKGAREIRYHEYEQKWQSMENAAKEIRESAGKELAATVIQGALQIGGGAVSARMTVKSTCQTNKLMKDMKSEGGSIENQNRFQGELQLQQNMSNIGQTVIQLGEGVGTIVGAPLTYASKLDQEEQKQQEAETEKHSAYIEELKDFIDTMKEIMHEVISKLAAIEQSKHETRQKIFS